MFLALVAACCSLLIGCGEFRDKSDSVAQEGADPVSQIQSGSSAVTDDQEPAPVAQVPAVPVVSPPLSPSAPSAPVPDLTLTPELEASSLRLQVTVGGAIQRSYGCVILAPSLFMPEVPPQAHVRLGLAWLPDYDEASLRDKACKMSVQRNIASDNTEPRFVSRQGTLAAYDAATQLAVIAFTETFPYGQDGQVQRAASIQSVHALLPLHDGIALPAPERPPGVPGRPEFGGPPQGFIPPVRYAPVTHELARARLEGDALVCDRLVQAGNRAPKTIAVLGSDGGLAGFAMRDSGQVWRFKTLAMPAVDTRGVRFTPQSLEVGYLHGNSLPLTLKGELYDIFNEASSFRLAYRLAGSGPLAAPEVDAVRPPAIEGAMEMQAHFSRNEGQITFNLPKPDSAAGDAKVGYVAQVVILDKRNQVVHRSATFGVAFERRGEAYYPSARGIALVESPGGATGRETVPQPVTNVLPPAATPLVEGEMTKLSLESGIARSFASRGGREVMVRLEGAPYWKRLSLMKRDWLPLPAEPLADCRLAGNEEAIFVLVPKERRLTRYNVETLAVEATVQLPLYLSPLDVAVGASSRHGPVAVICVEGRYACDPVTLNLAFSEVPRKDTVVVAGSERLEYGISGDGRELKGSVQGRSYDQVVTTYDDYYRGFFTSPSGAYSAKGPSTVSSTIEWSSSGITLPQPNGTKLTLDNWVRNRLSSSRGVAVGPLPAVPLYASLHLAEKQQVPPLPGVVKLYSLLDQTPLCTIASQEVAEMGEKAFDRVGGKVFFDPYSRSLAILTGSPTVVVRSLKPTDLSLPTGPVLLNYPEGVATRGGRYVFTPEVLGDPGWKLLVTPLLNGMQVDERGKVTWDVPENFIAGKVDLNFRLVGERGAGGAQFRHTMVIGGAPPVLAMATTLGSADMKTAIAQVTSGGVVPGGLVALSSWTYSGPRRVVDVLRGLTDYIPLRLEDGSIALYSVKDRRLAGSYLSASKTVLFFAGDCVLAYEPAINSITRLSLPDFKPVVTAPLPDRALLQGLGVGSHPDSPVSLVLDYAATTGFSHAQPQFRLVVVEKSTLIKGKWAQLPLVSSSSSFSSAGETYGLMFWRHVTMAMHVPTSFDGRVLCLPAGKIIISPTLTTGVPHVVSRAEGEKPQPTILYYPGAEDDVIASPSGDRLAVGRELYIGGKNLRMSAQNTRLTYSTCGNYVVSNDESREAVVSLSAADRDRPLLDLHNIATFRLNDGASRSEGSLVKPFGDHNLIVARNISGSLIQFIECDLPIVLKQAAPETVMVTSQHMPFIAQGRTMEYKITVNNPDAVASMRLRDSVASATINSAGVLIYRAPSALREAASLQICVEIVLKNGNVIPHEIPLHVIPVR